MATTLAFYATPGPMTATDAVDAFLLADLPPDADGLCRITSGLILHEHLAGVYGVPHLAGREQEVETRTVAEMAAAIAARDASPLVTPRPPAARMAGNCRHHAVMTVALLRRAGIPARARAGFASYFGGQGAGFGGQGAGFGGQGAGRMWTDHWLVERWVESQGRWVRTDPQLDAVQLQLFGVPFDPLDVPAGAFLSGSEAWQRCRQGLEDPERFGIGEMNGLWFVAGSAMRDLAALNKVEVHAWDVWGAMHGWLFAVLRPEQLRLVDAIAEAATAADRAAVQALFAADELRVPRRVTSHRFQRTVTLPIAD